MDFDLEFKDLHDSERMKKVRKYSDSLINQVGESFTDVKRDDKNEDIGGKKKVIFTNEKDESFVDITVDEIFKLIYAESEEKQMEESNELINVMYECQYCHYGNPSKKVLQRHMKSHLESKGYKCQVCHYEFQRLETFQCHCKSIYESQEREHSEYNESLQSIDESTNLPVIDDNSKNDEFYGLHTKQNKKKSDDKVSPKEQKLKSTPFQKQKTNKLYSCCTCNKSFPQKTLLNRHYKRMHKLLLMSHNLKLSIKKKEKTMLDN